jgi:inner membrane protein
MGYIIYRAVAKPPRTDWRLIAFCLFGANAADLDFVPGLLVGDLGRFHHGPAHSLTFAILFGGVAAVLSRCRGAHFVVAFLLYASHLALDYLVQDPTPPFGLQLFWPFSSEYHMSPFAFFRRFDYTPALTRSIVTFFSIHNIITMAVEIVLLLPLLLVVSLPIRRRPARPSRNARAQASARR